jgi:TPR repeat protein
MKKQLYLLSILFSVLVASENTPSFWETYTAALRGDKIAQFDVGVIYERGLGREQNMTQAAQWFEKSALQGHVDAQYNVALMYASGRGVEADEGRAMMWLARAAKQGDREARKLLLSIIDGVKTENTAKDTNQEESSTISPVTLIAKEGAMVCGKNNECIPYKARSVFTSTHKKGKYYKISGTVTKIGWKSYPQEGWIDEDNVDVRR